MSNLQTFIKEFTAESVVTRKMLERIPVNKLEWAPHVKSMPLKKLATHIAELPDWISMAFTTDGLDFQENPYQLSVWDSIDELLMIFEKSLKGALEHLKDSKEEDLLPEWILKNGDQVLAKFSKGELVRHAISQTIHHRAQLGVYLRLLDIPIPGTYGPSADDPNF